MMQKLYRGSEVQDFLRCRLKWKYAWVDKLTPKTPNDKLFFGTLFHKFVEVWYAYGKDFERAFAAMEYLYTTTDTQGMPQTDLDDLWAMACKVVVNYHQTYAGVDMFKVLAQELTFALTLDREGRVYTGTIDLVYGVDSQHIDFSDHKTTVSLDKYEKNARMDRQISRYWWALQQILKGKGMLKVNGEWVKTTETDFYKAVQGKEIRQFVYNIVLKDFPEPPKVLKSGKLSQAKDQKTTYELYLQEIEKLGQNTEDYKDFLQFLQESPKQFFRRVEVQRNQSEIDAAIREAYETIQDMDNPRVYRNITSDCTWDCPFRDVCIAGMDGSNVNLLLTTLFKQDEGR